MLQLLQLLVLWVGSSRKTLYAHRQNWNGRGRYNAPLSLKEAAPRHDRVVRCSRLGSYCCCCRQTNAVPPAWRLYLVSAMFATRLDRRLEIKSGSFSHPSMDLPNGHGHIV